MKKKLLIAFFFTTCALLHSLAQITVASSDLINIGYQSYQVHDSFPNSTIFPGPGGTNQVWNFSTLDTNSYDTLSFVDASTTPYASDFTSANFSYYLNTATNNNNGIAYTLKTTGGLYVEGFTALLPDTAHHLIKEFVTPHSPIIQFPCTYGSNYIDNYTVNAKSGYDLFYTYDSIRIKNKIVGTSNIDAWGNVTTPLGTFASLRQHKIKFETDSTWLHKISPPSWIFAATAKDTIDTFTWWTNAAGIGLPIVEMDYNDTASKVKWLFANPTGVNELENSFEFSVFPNPSTNFVRIKINEQDCLKISLMDITGKSLLTIKNKRDNEVQINTTELQNGIYFILIENKEGKKSVKKLSVLH